MRLEQIIANHLLLHGEYRAGNVGCMCGWEAFVGVDPTVDNLDQFKTETFAKHVAEAIRELFVVSEGTVDEPHKCVTVDRLRTQCYCGRLADHSVHIYISNNSPNVRSVGSRDMRGDQA